MPLLFSCLLRREVSLPNHLRIWALLRRRPTSVAGQSRAKILSGAEPERPGSLSSAVAHLDASFHAEMWLRFCPNGVLFLETCSCCYETC